MKAIGYLEAKAIDQPGALLDIELPMPTATGRDVLVNVNAISVNPVDTKIRRNAQPNEGEYKILGWDAVGEIVAIGDDVEHYKVGDKVWYAGDITRTIPIGGTFSDQQKDIYNIVLSAEMTAIETIRPGIQYRDIHLKIAKQMADGLQHLGLMHGDLDDAVQQGAHALFFPHGLGHMIGLDVHDMENLGEDYVGYDDTIKRSSQFGLKSLRLGKTLQAGYVITVEPGLYFIPALIEQWKAAGTFTEFINYDKLDAYLDFGGIRIEDDVLVTTEGARVLGTPIPKMVKDVEALASA